MQDLSNKVTDDQLTADEWNQSQRELINLIELAGLVPSSGDLTQVLKALGVVANLTTFFNTAGLTNTVELNSLTGYFAPTAYTNGMKVRWVPAADNTTAVTLNVNGLGARPLIQSDGATALPAGLLKAEGFAEATYNTSLNSFVLNVSALPTASDTTAGLVQLATFDQMTSPVGETSVVPSLDPLVTNVGYYQKGAYKASPSATTSNVLSDVAEMEILLDNVVPGFFSQYQSFEMTVHLANNASAAAAVDLSMYQAGLASSNVRAYYYYSDRSTGAMVYAGRTINGGSPSNSVNIPSSAYNTNEDILVRIIGTTITNDPTDTLRLAFASTDNVTQAVVDFGSNMLIRKLRAGTP